MKFVLVGKQLGLGNIPPEFALPALLAINSQAGCGFCSGRSVIRVKQYKTYYLSVHQLM